MIVVSIPYDVAGFCEVIVFLDSFGFTVPIRIKRIRLVEMPRMRATVSRGGEYIPDIVNLLLVKDGTGIGADTVYKKHLT